MLDSAKSAKERQTQFFFGLWLQNTSVPCLQLVLCFPIAAAGPKSASRQARPQERSGGTLPDRASPSCTTCSEIVRKDKRIMFEVRSMLKFCQLLQDNHAAHSTLCAETLELLLTSPSCMSPLTVTFTRIYASCTSWPTPLCTWTRRRSTSLTSGAPKIPPPSRLSARLGRTLFDRLITKLRTKCARAGGSCAMVGMSYV